MKTVFLFSGQGSQYAGMGKDLYENDQQCRQLFEKAEDVLSIPLKQICFENDLRLSETSYIQPAIFCVSAACLSLFKRIGPSFDAVAGLSLGEYTALYAASAISFSDSLQLLRKRGTFMAECAAKTKTMMIAIFHLDAKKIEAICEEDDLKGKVFCANYNNAMQTVIAGEEKMTTEAARRCMEKGAKRVIPLKDSAAFHTIFMLEAANRLKPELFRQNWKQPDKEVISNVIARPIPSVKEIPSLLTRQITRTVRWKESMEYLIRAGARRFVEIGPGKVLSGLLKKTDPTLEIYHVENMKTFDECLKKWKENADVS